VARSSLENRYGGYAMATALCLACLACDRPPSADSLPEWTPGDHHSADDDKLQGQAASQAPAARGPAGQGTDYAQLVDLTWRQQCTSCHGPAGRGDGQMGAMLQVRDLSDPEWQSKVTNEQIATTIKSGKNKMPKFDLPDPVIQGLVLRIRSLGGN
jgi:cytochrome c oxidase cbb3-type subunit 3